MIQYTASAKANRNNIGAEPVINIVKSHTIDELPEEWERDITVASTPGPIGSRPDGSFDADAADEMLTAMGYRRTGAWGHGHARNLPDPGQYHAAVEPVETASENLDIAGHPRSGHVDPELVSDALRDVFVPGHAVRDLCPWPDAQAREEAVASGDLVRYPALPGAEDVTVSPRAAEALQAVQPQEIVHRAAQHLVARSFSAWVTGDGHHLAAVAGFRFDDGPMVASGLGNGTVPGTSIVLVLWDEVRDEALAAAAAYEQAREGADLASECY